MSLNHNTHRAKYLSSPKRYTGMMDAVMKMVTQEGIRSLWRGILPNLAMSAPYSGLTFYFYSAYQAVLEKWWNKGIIEIHATLPFV